jgi:periplasmic divalent cation tolerance protein
VTGYPIDPPRARGPMRLVLTTYPDRTAALRAARSVLERRLAACANVVAIDSAYWWKGRIASGTEAMVLFKTVPKRVGHLFRYLAESHPYEVPEVAEVDVPRVAERYLAYLSDTLDPGGAVEEVGRPPARRRGAPRGRGAPGPARTRGRPRPRSR